MKIPSYSINEKIWLFFSIALVCFYVGLATWANADLSAGRFALFMDERITFDGVHHILHPDGLKDFILSVVHGGDHRYGRSLWNTIAIFSYLPEHIFGETGQIIAGRMAQVVILASAFILLAVTFVKHWAFRFLLLASLLAMPYTEYYMSMPKPEPLQILFLSIFFFFFKKNEMGLKGWYWIFLGLAFGTKISTLPAVAILLVAVFVKYLASSKGKNFASELTGAFGFFLLGLAIAVPILLPHLVLSFVAFKMLDKFLVNKWAIQHWGISITVAASLVVINSIASGILALKFKLKIPLAVWFYSTFLNTGHGSDSSSVNFASWVHFFFYDWLIAPVTVTVILVGISLFLLFQLARSNWHSLSNLPMPLVVFMSGLALNLAIFVAAHRLWGIYLFPGTILMLVGLFAIFETNLTNWSYRANDNNQANKLGTCASIVGLTLIIVVTFFWWSPHCFAKYEDNASRTRKLEYKNQYQSYIEITSFLARYSDHKKRQIMVAFDAWLFIPRSNAKYQINEFFGPYTNWKDTPDVLIFSSRQITGADYVANSPAYNNFLLERESYSKQVINNDQKCTEAVCYERQMALPNGGEILTLREHAKF